MFVVFGSENWEEDQCCCIWWHPFFLERIWWHPYKQCCCMFLTPRKSTLNMLLYLING